MPSGRTHDRITLWSLPLVAGVTFGQTNSTSLTLLLSGGYLFSGLMFGPDLDIYSRQYQRWGLLRWIWIPYRRSMRHRAFLSHGPIVGTIVRILYVLTWLAALVVGVVLLSAIACLMIGESDAWSRSMQQYWQLGSAWVAPALQHPGEWIALVIGLELGAMSHSLSDWVGSAYKRRFGRKPRKPRKNKSVESAIAPPVYPISPTPPSPQSSARSPVELPPLPPLPRDSQNL